MGWLFRVAGLPISCAAISGCSNWYARYTLRVRLSARSVTVAGCRSPRALYAGARLQARRRLRTILRMPGVPGLTLLLFARGIWFGDVWWLIFRPFVGSW